MVRKRVSTIELIKRFRSLDKGFFTIPDLQKITDLSRDSLKVSISRLVDKGVLVRIKRGIYQSAFSEVDVPRIANQLYYPSYLSFQSVLSMYSILSQIPYTQTFATNKKSKTMVLLDTEVEFRQISDDLFFGYEMKDGMYVAKPEKALLDQLYMVSRGVGLLNIEELDLREIDKDLFEKYAMKYPRYMRKLVDKVLKYVGSASISNEDKTRIG